MDRPEWTTLTLVLQVTAFNWPMYVKMKNGLVQLSRCKVERVFHELTPFSAPNLNKTLDKIVQLAMIFTAQIFIAMKITTQLDSFWSKFHLFPGLQRCQLTRDLLYALRTSRIVQCLGCEEHGLGHFVWCKVHVATAR